LRQHLQTDEISVLKVESIQFITGLLCVHDIFIDHKCGAFRGIVDSLADLSGMTVLAVCLHDLESPREQEEGRTGLDQTFQTDHRVPLV
jgi:hypothetical protein